MQGTSDSFTSLKEIFERPIPKERSLNMYLGPLAAERFRRELERQLYEKKTNKTPHSQRCKGSAEQVE